METQYTCYKKQNRITKKNKSKCNKNITIKRNQLGGSNITTSTNNLQDQKLPPRGRGHYEKNTSLKNRVMTIRVPSRPYNLDVWMLAGYERKKNTGFSFFGSSSPYKTSSGGTFYMFLNNSRGISINKYLDDYTKFFDLNVPVAHISNRGILLIDLIKEFFIGHTVINKLLAQDGPNKKKKTGQFHEYLPEFECNDVLMRYSSHNTVDYDDESDSAISTDIHLQGFSFKTIRVLTNIGKNPYYTWSDDNNSFYGYGNNTRIPLFNNCSYGIEACTWYPKFFNSNPSDLNNQKLKSIEKGETIHDINQLINAYKIKIDQLKATQDIENLLGSLWCILENLEDLDKIRQTFVPHRGLRAGELKVRNKNVFEDWCLQGDVIRPNTGSGLWCDILCRVSRKKNEKNYTVYLYTPWYDPRYKEFIKILANYYNITLNQTEDIAIQFFQQMNKMKPFKRDKKNIRRYARLIDIINASFQYTYADSIRVDACGKVLESSYDDNIIGFFEKENHTGYNTWERVGWRLKIECDVHKNNDKNKKNKQAGNNQDDFVNSWIIEGNRMNNNQVNAPQNTLCFYGNPAGMTITPNLHLRLKDLFHLHLRLLLKYYDHRDDICINQIPFCILRETEKVETYPEIIYKAKIIYDENIVCGNKKHSIKKKYLVVAYQYAPNMITCSGKDDVYKKVIHFYVDYDGKTSFGGGTYFFENDRTFTTNQYPSWCALPQELNKYLPIDIEESLNDIILTDYNTDQVNSVSIPTKKPSSLFASFFSSPKEKKKEKYYSKLFEYCGKRYYGFNRKSYRCN